VIFDTDVLIWYLRGRHEAADLLDSFDPVRLSAVTYMELVQGMRNADELRAFRSTLAGRRWQVLPITETISTRAMT
jgi:predicted nucleic acid-binding protein